MHYLIDTYNLLHSALGSNGSLHNLTVRRLCQHLAAQPTHIKATLVLDGRPKPDEPSPNEFPDITLLYSGTGVPADTVIAQTIERSSHRKKLTIVTNDRAVSLHARRHFANAISCEEFLRRLTQLPASPHTDTKQDYPQSPGEIDHWLRTFGLKDPNPQSPTTLPADPLADLNIEDLLGPRDPP